MIDAIIRSSAGPSRPRPRSRRCWPQPFEFSEEQAQHILDMPLRRLAAARAPEAARGVRGARGRRSPSSKRSSPTTSKLRAVIKDELHRRSGQVRRRPPHRDHHRLRRPRRPRPHRGRGARRRALAQGLREDRRGRRVPRAGPRRQRRARGEAARRGLRRAPADFDRALVSAVLLEPRAASTGCVRTRSR